MKITQVSHDRIPFILILSVVFLLMGCASYQQGLRNWSTIEEGNYKAARILAQSFVKTWAFNAGFIREALGPRLDLPEFAAMRMALDRGDELAEDCQWMESQGEPHDGPLGGSLGVRVRLLDATIQTALKQYAPEVLKYLKVLAL